ncbi:multisubunit sodium/proton antiporter, MrpA subunit [Alteribacillus persepolensis]|uniref:Multisubunit sodium/proton antiporter, MrpA subunit n=1 Tax=Alteribacillus persepolensis TaxID=568899 RepID=A0A1G8CM27_9BACI|nr:Na+/H+ antiporter subunit A [Alteribacillus persepolensis]SDH46528.1 multisubunit sodium/proton antiporter, MrpA subunit [Alteribacillus persepolensis]
MLTALHIAIVAPFIAAVFVPFLYKKLPKIHTGWFVLTIPAILFVYFLQYLPVTSSKQTVTAVWDWIPSLGIHFTAHVDGLGLLFALLITGIGMLVVLYSIYYLSKEREALNNFYTFLLMFMGAMLGVVLSDNLIVLYTFWEITSLSSFLLISYWYEREKSRYGALKSMLITVMGGFSMLVGFVMLYAMTGTFSIQEIIASAGDITSHDLFIPAMLTILLGAFTKSAQFPFHIWLPDAMEAPTPVSAYLHSATMVKAGIYLVARLSPVFAFSGEWMWIVAGFGIVTLFWGSFSAVQQTDLKGILAFSTVSQLGMILSMLGVGAAAIHFDSMDDNLYIGATTAAIFHLINHATFKGSLFMMAGIVDHETGTRDIRRLGGLMTVMPITFTIAVIGSFSMAGLPPFNGFLSKEMFFTAMVDITSFQAFNMDSFGVLFPVVAWVASIFTFIYSMMLVFKTFTGKMQPEKLDVKPHEAPFGMLLSPIILVSLVIVFGFFPNILAYTVIEPAMASILPSLLGEGEQFYVDIYFWHGWTIELYMTMGVIGIGTLLYLSLRKWVAVYDVFPSSLTLNHIYDQTVAGVEKVSSQLTGAYMTSSIRHYLLYIFSFFVVALVFVLFNKDAFSVDGATAPISVYEGVLAAVLVTTALVVMFTRSRLKAIIGLGVLGYTIALFFVIFRAPDLALTQLIIETVSVALFLLCFYHLPQISRKLENMRFRAGNFIVSLAVGLTVTLIGISANSSRLFESIAGFFPEASYDEAGGKNMVNVILVDFRGFDTLLEILVLAIAAAGIFTMIKLRLAGRNDL